MVRVFLKGGVWKNSEDEILKAAVQKYGKQQWARVASLLNRKSAKQCKARWHEWLDPSVRKVEWSREEEEKLLHLAKLLPAQWKTIGPLVGRTATQCQEQYEKLLDDAAAAAGKTDNDEDNDNDNLRHQPLRVGQIDSHPEAKPARPDPIDMDEDEIEMLQEARARLANTQGKKAKRKAREKMLQQAKRLTELQKRRELKQAGLLSSHAKKKSGKRKTEIDLGVEIPFHKPAPAGFHNVSNEAARSESLRAKQARSVDFKKLNESQYRSRDREAQQAQKREEARLRTLEKTNMQYVVAQVSKANDPLNMRKRGPLSLPAPTVTDQELQQLAKLEDAASSANMAPATGGGSGGATQALLADYSDRPLPTPMRTPMTAAGGGSSSSTTMSKQQNILREASNLRMLERGQTPLLGGEDPVMLQANDNDNDDYNGGGGQDSKTSGPRPSTPGGPPQQRAPTPSRRDHFGLNAKRPHSELRDSASSVGASTFATSTNSIREMARDERRAAKRARQQLEDALAALPAPQFEYELEAPSTMMMDIDDDEKNKVETVDNMMMEEDAADIEAAQQRRLQQEAEKAYEARSSVVKRSELPRPVGSIPEPSLCVALKNDDDDDDEAAAAEQIINQERWTLLRHDAHAFPVEAPPSWLLLNDKKKRKTSKKASKSSDEASSSLLLPPETPLDVIPEDALTAAKTVIQSELERLLTETTQPLMTTTTLEQAKEGLFQATMDARTKNDHQVFATNGWTDTATTTNTTFQKQAFGLELDALQEATSALRKSNEKVESKLALWTGGYSKRSQQISSNVLVLYGELRNALIEEAVYQNLQRQEELGSVRRIDKLRADIRQLGQDEAELQSDYQGLVAQQQQQIASQD
jgi:pre-mRNA-splicing factor CDC5/CEF1